VGVPLGRGTVESGENKGEVTLTENYNMPGPDLRTSAASFNLSILFILQMSKPRHQEFV
jgi:hypothetical protein